MIRFTRRIRILPGVAVNLAKRGVSSVSIGPRGAKVNVNRRGVSATISAPGTGLSWRQRIMQWGWK